jgi:hypothetical protein
MASVSFLLFAADLYLVGLGITVALVVYPSFHLVGSGQWTSFHGAHSRRIGVAAAPAWVLQGMGSIWWLLHGPSRGFAGAHAFFALLAVVLTVFKLMPVHQRLERHHDSQDIHQLQRWHWLRTLAWIACTFLALRPL